MSVSTESNLYKVEELIERLEGDSSGPYYDALTSFALRREAAQAIREQQAEIERLKRAMAEAYEPGCECETCTLFRSFTHITVIPDK